MFYNLYNIKIFKSKYNTFAFRNGEVNPYVVDFEHANKILSINSD